MAKPIVFNLEPGRGKGSRSKIISREIRKQLTKELNLRKIKRADLRDLAEDFIAEKKNLIAKGISPIREKKKRFPAYKDPKKYPGPKRGSIRRRYPGKKPRPVNLKLSGKFLNDLTYRVSTGKRPVLRIGFWKKKSILKEKGHREGSNKQPKRPIIPTARERYAVLLERKLFSKLEQIALLRFK